MYVCMYVCMYYVCVCVRERAYVCVLCGSGNLADTFVNMSCYHDLYHLYNNLF
jgi:hypothetical protein